MTDSLNTSQKEGLLRSLLSNYVSSPSSATSTTSAIAEVPVPKPISRQTANLLPADKESKRPEGQTKETSSLLSMLMSHQRKHRDKKRPQSISLISTHVKELSKLSTFVSLRPLLGNHHYTIRLVVTGALAADGTGTIATSLGLNPSTYSEWTSVSALFDEFRVLSGRFHFTPTNRYNRASTDVVRAVDVAFDNDSAPTLTSYNDAAEYANVKQECQSDPYVYSFHRPNVTPSAYWTDVATPSGSAGSVVLFSSGNTNSIALGIYMQEIFVEFRGRV